MGYAPVTVNFLHSTGTEGGGIEVRNFFYYYYYYYYIIFIHFYFSQFFAISESFAIFRNVPHFSGDFPQLLSACPPRVLAGALCVLRAQVLLLEASGGLAPQFSHNFPLLFAHAP